MATLRGMARARATATLSSRDFFFTTDTTAPAHGTSADRALWRMVPNSGKYAIPLYYWTTTTGPLPPGAPSTLELLAISEDDPASQPRFSPHPAGAPPAQGLITTLFGTDDGTVGTDERCGSLRLYVRAQVAGLGSYNVNSDDTDPGITQAPDIIESITFGTGNNDTYPAGDTYAYGATADEFARVNINHTPSFDSFSHQEGQIVVPEASAGGSGTFYDWFEDHSGNGHTLTQGATPTTNQASSAKFVEGRYFNGDNDARLYRDDAAFNLTGDMAVTVVFQLDGNGLANNHRVLAVYGNVLNAVATNVWALSIFQQVAGGNNLRFSQAGNFIEGNTNLTNDSAEHTVTVRRSGTTVDMYLDGVLEATGTIAAPTGQAGGRLAIGARGDGAGQALNGAVYDVGVWGSPVPSQATLDTVVGATGTDDPEGTEVARWSMRSATRGATAVDLNGIVQDVSGDSVTTDDFLVGDDFDNTAADYGAEYNVIGNSLIVPASGAVPWTFLVDGGGTGVTVSSDTLAERDAWMAIDPRIAIANFLSDFALYNIHETTGTDYNIQNARMENITRAATGVLIDSLGAQKATSAQSQANRTLDYTLLNGDDATNDLTGKQWQIYPSAAGTYDGSVVNAFSVTTFKAVNSAATLSVPGDPTSADNMIVVDRPGASSDTVLNYGQSVNISYYMYGGRGQLLGDINTPDARSKTVNSVGTVEDDSAVQLSGGQVSYTYSPALTGSGHTSAADLIGDLKHVRFNYNDGAEVDSDDGFGLSSLQQADDAVFGDGIWTGKSNSDLDANGAPDDVEFSDFFVGADIMYAKAKILDAAGDPYDDAVVTMTLKRQGIVEQGPKSNTQSQTESGFLGWTDAFEQFDVSAPAGARTFHVSAARGDNAMPEEVVDIVMIPSYTGDLFFRVVMNRDGNDLQVSLQPVVHRGVDNEAQLLSEVTPERVVDVAPRGEIVRFVGIGSPLVTPIAQQTFSQLVPMDDDNWEHTFDITGLVDGMYCMNVVMSIDGGQVPARIPFFLGPNGFVGVQHDALADIGMHRTVSFC